jgi:hypothetical protein
MPDQRVRVTQFDPLLRVQAEVTNQPARRLLHASIGGPAPAASAILTADDYWAVRAINIVMVTTATAGNRRLAWALKDGNGSTIMTGVVAFLQPASQAYQYNLFPGAPLSTTLVGVDKTYAPIPPDFEWGPGYKFSVADDNGIDVAGDTYSIDALVRAGPL